MPKWLRILAEVGPKVLMFTPLAPIADAVTFGIQTAEAIPGASSEQKKALVQQIVAVAANAANAQAGKVVLDPAEAAQAAHSAIDTTVAVANLVHDTHTALATAPAA